MSSVVQQTVTPSRNPIQVTIPKSVVLENPDQYGEIQVDIERKKLVRATMDTLIGVIGGRPSETEILTLARSIATQYPILRDREQEGVRDNYVMFITNLHENLKGYLLHVKQLHGN